MRTTPYDIEFLTTCEELNRFRPKWEALYSDSEASPYLSYGWLETALRHFPPTGGFFLGVIRDHGEVKALVPLEIAREKMGPIPQRVLRFAQDGWALSNGAVVARGVRENEYLFVVSAIDSLASYGVSWDYCRLALVPERIKANFMDDVNVITSSNISSSEHLKMGSSVIIELFESHEIYLKSLNSKKRDNIKRRTKLLQQRGAMRMVRLGTSASPRTKELDRTIEDALTVSVRSWQGSSATGRAISDEDVRGFFREVCQKMAHKGMLDLSVLYVDDHPVSFYWGPVRHPRTSITKIGFDPEFSQCSPGTVHLAQLIAGSLACGIKEIDLGHEFPDYKRFWGTREENLYEVFLYPRGMIPSATRLLRSLKRAWRGSNDPGT